MFRIVLVFTVFLSFVGCKKEGPIGIPFPRYPGSAYAPQARDESQAQYTLYSARLTTPDAYQTVLDWYKKALGGDAEWKMEPSDMGWTRWSNGNVQQPVHGTNGYGQPKDPSKEAKIITVTDANGATVYFGHAVPKAAAQ
jgi:hypothetical protein